MQILVTKMWLEKLTAENVSVNNTSKCVGMSNQ